MAKEFSGMKYDGLSDIPDRTFEPIGNLVVLKVIPVDKSPGGIHLPDQLKDLDAPQKTDRKSVV